MSERNGAPSPFAEPAPRSKTLGFLLTALVGLAFLALLYFVSEFFLYLVLAVLALFGLVGLHWFLWGRRMTQDTQEERRQLLEHDAEAERKHAAKPPPWERRF